MTQIFAVVAVPCLIMLYNLLDNLWYKGITNWFLADTYGSVLIHGVMHGAGPCRGSSRRASRETHINRRARGLKP